MFEIEQSRNPQDLARVVDKLCKLLVADDLAEVRRDFATWLKRLIVPSRFAEFEFEEIQQLEEFRVMIEERVKEWTRQWEANGYQRGREDGMEAGRRDGMEAGIEAGRRDGLAQVLKSQLQLKFGSLSADFRQRLDSASFETLESWSRQILTADSLQQIFDGSGE